MWNDTDTPLAFFISFRAYGTWLHGDPRGSTDRHNNSFGSPHYPPIDHWNQISKARLKHDPVTLRASRRTCAMEAIKETCEKRGWGLLAINVRTNHVHTVVSAPMTNPDKILSAFKANATREMREKGCWPHEHSPWAAKGSKRRLWHEKSVASAIDYVINGQGDDLPDFE